MNNVFGISVVYGWITAIVRKVSGVGEFKCVTDRFIVFGSKWVTKHGDIDRPLNPNSNAHLSEIRRWPFTLLKHESLRKPWYRVECN